MKTKLFLISVLVFAFSTALTTRKGTRSLFKYEITKDYVEIPAGQVVVEGTQDAVEAFAISRYEITNEAYLKFLSDLKAENKAAAYETARVWVEQWGQSSANQNFQNSYHTYPGFASFPVVNITRQGAELYCKWLTEKFRQEHKTNFEVTFRLPTRKEWIRAARGENMHATYAWGSPYIRGGNGYYLCNFKRLGSERIHFDETTQSYEVVVEKEKLPNMIMDKVDAYSPNTFGLYNVCGNVAEMIEEEGKAVGGSWNDPGFDVRVESIKTIAAASPYVGFRPVMVIKEK